MRRRAALLLSVLALLGAAVAAGCGGEEEATPTPDEITGTPPAEPEQPEQPEPEEPQPEPEPDVEGDPVAGKSIFLANCAACHVLADAGTTGTVGPSLDEWQPSFEAAVEITTNGRGGMPAFSDTLSEQQIADVSAYITEAAG